MWRRRLSRWTVSLVAAMSRFQATAQPLRLEHHQREDHEYQQRGKIVQGARSAIVEQPPQLRADVADVAGVDLLDGEASSLLRSPPAGRSQDDGEDKQYQRGIDPARGVVETSEVDEPEPEGYNEQRPGNDE